VSSLPTYQVRTRFWNDYHQLTAVERAQFLQARADFIAALDAWEQAGCPGVPRFPARLSVKAMQGQRNIKELAWAPDGRCTWEYGTPVVTGRAHVIWRRIGSHEIYSDP
jgi:hypothetical protein